MGGKHEAAFDTILGLVLRAQALYRNAITEQSKVLVERINLLSDRLEKAEAEAPLAVTERIKKQLEITEDRYKALEEELEKALQELAMKDGELRRFQESSRGAYQRIIQVTADKAIDVLVPQTFEATLSVLAQANLLKSGKDYIREALER
jgi:ABC-type Mn2+/Zn2+ transport system ATPase subunit